MQTYKNYQVVIVDDGSTDGSAEAIKIQYPAIHIITGTGQWWWTASMNRGLEYVLQKAHEEDYVLTLNDDVEFHENYLEQLVQISKKHPTACIGSTLKNFYDQNHVEDSGVKILWDGYWFQQVPYQEQQKTVRVDTLSCRGALIPVNVFKKIGLFNERYLPHYLADYEFFIRAHRHGIDLLMSYEAVVYNKDDLKRPKQKRSVWWKMFNKKSPANIFNTYYILLKYSPTMYLKIKNFFSYTLRSFSKI
jgi:GT2 family glycosyltransferase